MKIDSLALRWIGLAVACGVMLHVYDAHSTFHPASIQDTFSIPLPARVELLGEVTHFRISSGAWVFDLVNGGTITCYFRHPPSTIFPLNHEWARIRGRIDPTPRGRLCVVEEWLGSDTNGSIP